MKTNILLLGLIALLAACVDTNGQKGDGSATNSGSDGGDGVGDGPDGDGVGDGEEDEIACDPAVDDCDDACLCDGSPLEDDCVEHQCASGCTEQQGYWKQNEAAWPVTEMTLGGRVYDTPTLVAIMNLPTWGDASITLATHLIAVKLNLVAGVVDAELMDEIAAADAWLAANDDEDGLPLDIHSGDVLANEALTLASEFADFNDGLVGPGTCTSEEETTEETETTE